MKRERYLSNSELSSLGKTLEKCEFEQTESPYVIAALRLLILTGCRLVNYVLEILAYIPKVENNPFIIVGNKEERHITDMQKPWRRIPKAASLEDVRIHDLRHTFASGAVSMGESLPMIGKLLGHSQVQTTARYAHLQDDPVHSAAERVSGVIAEALFTK